MQNSDIKNRFEDWLLNPYEDLECEVKGWLDLSNAEDRAKIAKALIALENSGGGRLIIGFTKGTDGGLVPDNGRPDDLSKFNSDEFNAIVKRFAEPVFHVDVRLMTASDSQLQFPYIIIHGKSKVPVRSSGSTQGKSIADNVYYIRRPGPSSESPQSGAEWDDLITRCMLKNKDEILSVFRNYAGDNLSFLFQHETSKLSQSRLDSFCSEALKRWDGLNKALPDSHLSKIKNGYFYFACEVIGDSKNLSPPQIKQQIESLQKYTGWPIFVTLYDADVSPKLVENSIEAWLAKIKYPDVSNADFWKVTPDGMFFSLRGYQEDGEAIDKTRFAIGKNFDLTLPIWRLSEFILRSNELASKMFNDGYELVIKCCWTGIANRKLVSMSGNRMLFDDRVCAAEKVTSNGKFTGEEVVNLLPEVVKKLTTDLYASFDFYEPSISIFAEEIRRMRTRT